MNVKNIIQKIKKPALAIVVSASIAFSLLIGLKNNANKKFDEFETMDDVEDFAEAVDCDVSYQQPRGKRLMHNGEEPIYVSISDKLKKEHKDAIVGALDYWFSIVGGINENYRYELVDNVIGPKYWGKSTISFGVRNFDKTEQAEQIQFSAFSSLFSNKGVFLDKNKINFNKNFLNSNPDNDYIFACALHEIMHCFGYDDVYCDNKHYYGNSIMDVFFEKEGLITQITPNDYLFAISNYHQKFANAEEEKVYIKKVKDFIDEYSQVYYDYVFDKYYELSYQQMKKYEFSDDEIKEKLKINQIENVIDLTFEMNENKKEDQIIQVIINNDKYVILTFDKYNNEIDNCAGKVYFAKGRAVLQNVELNRFINGKISNMDLYVEKKDEKIYSLVGLNNIAVASRSGEKTNTKNEKEIIIEK